MRILANENFPAAAVEALRSAGHEVAWVHTDAPGCDDQSVLQRAVAENRLLVTLDKDFGELAFRSKLPADCGIMLFRISVPSPEYFAQVALAAINSRTDWNGHFSVIEDHRIRMTPLPERL